MTGPSPDPMLAPGLHRELIGAMILAELLRSKHEGLNRGNGDPPIVV